MGIKVKDLVAAINGAGRTASDLRRIWKDANENGEENVTISAEVIGDWYRKVTGLVMMIQGFDIGE